MFAHFSRNEIKKMIGDAPNGVSAQQIINSLIDKGHTLEGFSAIGPQGPAGPRGEVGPMGAPGFRGPMGPMGPEGPTGPEGRTGPAGSFGRDGSPGRDGLNGKDGSPDTAEEIKNKLETLVGDSRLDAGAIKNLPQFTQRVIERVGGGFVETPLVDSSGRLLSKDAFGRIVINVSSTPTNSTTTVDGATMVFAVTSRPVKVYVDGGVYFEQLVPGDGGSYTYSAGFITLFFIPQAYVKYE